MELNVIEYGSPADPSSDQKTTIEHLPPDHKMSADMETSWEGNPYESYCELPQPERETARRRQMCSKDSIRKYVRITALALFTTCYLVYFILAHVWNFRQAIPLLCGTSIVVIYLAIRQVGRFDVIKNKRRTLDYSIKKFTTRILEQRRVRFFCYGAIGLVMLGYSIAINVHQIHNLISLVGLVVLLLFSWMISYNRRKICLRPVMWGLGGQMCLGALVLKTQAGQDAFAWLGHQVEIFINYVTAGVVFVFGEKYEDFYFALKLMPTVIFISSVISVLYHIGLMQKVVGAIAVVMKISMGTTASETVTTAASIFLGQPEASLTVRPYLNSMSRSELHAIMTAGFASVSADIFALFVNYGVSSAHILTAVLMSAPAGLAVSKIVYPQELASAKSDLKGSDITLHTHSDVITHDESLVQEDGRTEAMLATYMFAQISILILFSTCTLIYFSWQIMFGVLVEHLSQLSCFKYSVKCRSM